MAGTHQLWALHLARDPADNTVAVLAGTSAEGIRDGAAHDAWFAQPSGLATSADGQRLWVADSETSALRSLTLTGDGFEVTTHVGRGLFDFGHRDGAADQALMQHPLGVTVLPDGSVAVSDTYNGAIRRFDPVTAEVGTLATGLREPSDAVVEQDGDQTRLVVVESAAHQLTRVPLPAVAQRVDGLARETQRPPTLLAGGDVTVSVAFTPPTGQKLDHRFGDPTQLMVSSSPTELVREGGGTAPGLTRALHLDPRVGSGILHISVRAAACDGDPVTGEVPEHAACHLYQQDWGIPVVLQDGEPDTLTLDLRGV
jgi:DNA-binding beta-propeller fold protein YncE